MPGMKHCFLLLFLLATVLLLPTHALHNPKNSELGRRQDAAEGRYDRTDTRNRIPLNGSCTNSTNSLRRSTLSYSPYITLSTASPPLCLMPARDSSRNSLWFVKSASTIYPVPLPGPSPWKGDDEKKLLALLTFLPILHARPRVPFRLTNSDTQLLR